MHWPPRRASLPWSPPIWRARSASSACSAVMTRVTTLWSRLAEQDRCTARGSPPSSTSAVCWCCAIPAFFARWACCWRICAPISRRPGYWHCLRRSSARSRQSLPICASAARRGSPMPASQRMTAEYRCRSTCAMPGKITRFPCHCLPARSHERRSMGSPPALPPHTSGFTALSPKTSRCSWSPSAPRRPASCARPTSGPQPTPAPTLARRRLAAARCGCARLAHSFPVGRAGNRRTNGCHDLDRARRHRHRRSIPQFAAGAAMSAVTANSIDPITVEVIGSALSSIVEEMGEALVRASFSTNIKERRDCSTALFDTRGTTLCQAEHIPMHLGSFIGIIPEILKRHPVERMQPGDVFIGNDAYAGAGTHLPDIVLGEPIFVDGRIVAWAVNTAHHADFADRGHAHIYQEGLRIPPIRLYRAGELQSDVQELILLNCQVVPRERLSDLRAQMAAN